MIHKRPFLLLCHLFIFFIFINLSLTSSSQNINSKPSFYSHVIDSLNKLLKKEKEDTSRVNILSDLSTQFLNLGEYETAKDYILQAELLSKKINYKKGIAISQNKLGTVYLYKNDYKQAMDYYFAALKKRNELGNKKDIANTLSNIGIVYSRLMDYTNAFKYIYKGLIIREDLEDKQGISSTMIILGNLYMIQKKYSNALQCYLKGLNIEKERKNKTGISDFTILIGNTYLEQNNFTKALVFYSKGLKIKEDLNDKNGISQLLYNMAVTYYKQNNFSMAREYFIKELKITEEIGEKQSIANALYSIGLTYSSEKKYSYFIEFLRKADTLYKQINNYSGEEKICFEFGNLYDTLSQNDKSYVYFKRGLEISKQIGDKEYTILFYKSLMNHFIKINKYKEANTFQELYFKMKDTLLNEVKEKQIADIQIKYETEKKEKEIETLTQKNQILKQQNKIQILEVSRNRYIIFGLIGLTVLIVLIGLLFLRQYRLKALYIKTAIEQKLLRSQMNPHFIFNTMMGVQNYIYKQDPESAVKYLSSIVKLMRSILESSREEYISLEKEITSLEHYLILQQLRFKDKFDFTIDIDPAIELENTSIPPMFAQPFIENAIEHGILHKTNGKGLILIKFELKEKTLIMEIKDNGIGRERSKEINQLHQNEHLSVATNITKERLTMLNRRSKKRIQMFITDLKNSNNEAEGTKVTFIFPLTYTG